MDHDRTDASSAFPSAPVVRIGGPDDDYIPGTRRDDELRGLGGDDQLVGFGGGDTLLGGAGDDDLSGNGSLSGGGGDDRIDIGRGRASGGSGDDLFFRAYSDGKVVFSGEAGDDLVKTSFYGLDGKVDRFDGGAGEDRYELVGLGRSTSVEVRGDLAGSASIVIDGEIFVELSGVESLFLLGGTGDDSIIGGAGDDTIFLIGSGADVVRTGDGDDTVRVALADEERDLIELGRGDDIASIRHEGDEDVVMNAGPGGIRVTMDGVEAALIRGAFGYDIVTGAGDDALFGGDADTRFVMNGGADTLDCGGGDDRATVRLDLAMDEIDGGDGFDALDLDILTADVGDRGVRMSTAGGLVTVAAGGATLAELRGFERIDADGTVKDDLLVGLALDDALQGEDGSDTLRGGAGDDTLSGGGGSDRLIGGAGDDLLRDVYGVNDIVGGTGVDTVDFYYVNDDIAVVLVVGETVGVTVADRSGGTLTGVENLIGAGGDDTLVGDDGANVIAGDSGRNVLDGGGGVDTVDYSAHNFAVTLSLATGRATVDDRLFPTSDRLSGFENVIGGFGNDGIEGDDGDNRLDGGAGGDTLTGGAGRDVFVVRSFGDSGGYGRYFTDLITDFRQGEDSIDLSSIDAIDPRLLGREGGDEFSFIGDDRFSGAAGELRFRRGDVTFVLGDVDGDGAADFTVRIAGDLALKVDDFVL